MEIFITMWLWYSGHSPRTRHPGVWSQVGTRKHYYNKPNRDEGIPAEIFKTLKGDAV